MFKTYLTAAIMGCSLLSNLAWSTPDLTVKYLPLDQLCCSVMNMTVSEDGRYVAYRSTPVGTSTVNIYVMDLQTGTRTQANRMVTGGLPTDARCDMPAMSADARYVVFGCATAAMGSQQTPSGDSYYVYDRINDKTEVVPLVNSNRVSRTYAAAISKNGRYIAYRSYDSAPTYTLYVRDTLNKTTQAATGAKAVFGGVYMSLSDDGRYVTYTGRPSSSSSLQDVYMYDMATGVSEMINVTSAGVPGTRGANSPVMSGDASVVSFFTPDPKLTNAAGLGGVVVRNRRAGTTEFISQIAAFGLVSYNSMSANGRYIAFTGNPVQMEKNLYLYDVLTKVIRVIPGAINSQRTATFSAFSADGRYFLFESQTIASPATKSIGMVDLGVAPDVALSSHALTLTEGGAAGTYTVVLTQAPDANVTVTVKTGSQLSLARTQLVFTPDNWSEPQVVSVQAIADGITEGSHSATIVHTVASSDVNYSVVTPADVTVTISDGIIPTLVTPGAAWSKTEMPLSGTAAPGVNVLLTASNRSTGWLSSVSTVADAQGNWSYTLSGYTDGVIDLDAQADGLKSVVRTVTVTLAVTAPAPTYIDVTGYIRTTAASLSYNRSTGKYVGDLVLTNSGSITLNGPLQLQFDNLTAGITLTSATGTHDGAPYITIPAGLEPDQAVTIPLVFDNPARGDIGYAAKIYSGAF